MIKKSFFDVCGGDCNSCSYTKTKDKGGEVILSKRKVTKKFVPPELSAIKLLLELKNTNDDIFSLSDEELLKLQKDLMGRLNV